MKPELYFGEEIPTFIRANPKIEFKNLTKGDLLDSSGVLVVYPAQNLGFKLTSEIDFYQERTNRNKNLITEAEQKKYHTCRVGIIGLSVGYSILKSLVVTGGPKSIKIADHDTLDVSNLNRIDLGLKYDGVNKAFAAATEMWGIDPFLDLTIYDQGINEQSLESFITTDPKLDILIDEMDNLKLKGLARVIAKKNKIPVIMCTDNEDGVILDIERYDLDSNYPIFHGAVAFEDIEASSRDKGNPKLWLEQAKKIMGEQYLTPRHLASIKEIGKSLSGPPQLGTAAALAGATAAYVVRQIANSSTLPSGKYILDLPTVF